MKILGISSFYHDSAVALIEDGVILKALQEERFSRIKNDDSFPQRSIKHCLSSHGLSLKNIDFISFYDKPYLKFERILETYLAFAPNGFQSFKKSIPMWTKTKLFQKEVILEELHNICNSNTREEIEKKILFSSHHLSHAASAFYPSPFKEAAILTMDGVGEWSSTSVAFGEGNTINFLKEINFPHSIGLLYSAFTFFCGFKVNSGEYKLMGLAPYGQPRFRNLIFENLIDLKEDGSFRLEMGYFNYCVGLTMTNDKFHDLFGSKPRSPESPLTQFHMDIAASIQAVIEEIILKIASYVLQITDSKNLCLAGGVALNCVANGKLIKSKLYNKIWVQPASGDAGGAIGAALASYHMGFNNPRKISVPDGMKGSFLGAEYTQNQIADDLRSCKAKFHKLPEKKVISEIALQLSKGKAVGWMDGPMEFGPRALGHRSILADPRNPEMQKNLNLKIKFRESFRPFAPSVLEEDVKDWFEIETLSPYMLFVSNVIQKKRSHNSPNQTLFGIDKLHEIRSEIPSVTHVDYSARIQTVNRKTNPKFYSLIKKFKEITGCPILINTSFNLRGEPIVCSPKDAFKCFMACDLDILVIGNNVLYKVEQDQSLKVDYMHNYELD